MSNISQKLSHYKRTYKLQVNPIYKLPFLWIKNRNLSYSILDLNKVLNYKKSDTIFLIGSGPSLNELNDKQLEIINQHDSFSINFSFIFDKITPTFHQQEDGQKQWNRLLFLNKLKDHRQRLSKTIWAISSRTAQRGYHPRLTPSFFPENPICWYFKYPSIINLERKRPFNDEDFKNSLIYRGSISVVLDIVTKLEYKNIVLLGVDLDKASYFFDDINGMREYSIMQTNVFKKNNHSSYVSMLPIGNKYHPMDVYFYSLKDYLERKRNINLFIGSKNNILYPKLPCYFN